MDVVARLKQRLRESEQRNEALQNEVASLRAEFASFRHDHEALAETTRAVVGDRDLLKKRVAELEVVNKRLVDMLWGRRTERRSESPDQMQLPFAVEPPGDEEEEIITAQQEADEASDQELLRRLKARRKARQAKRQARNEDFPADIERRERTIDLSEEEKQGLTRIGEKVTEKLRFEKPHAYVEVIKRPQYVVAGQPEAGVRSAPPPLSIVEGCKYDFSVIAAIVAMKFAFHMPTYRQQDWFGQCGWFPSRSTVNDLINYAVATYRGIFVGDASGVNARLEQRSGGRVVHASCNAHARREFVKAESNDPILASQGISFYRQLYDVEERAKTLDAAGRYELRQRDAVPIWDRMERWLASDAAQQALPRSAIGEALGYMRNQWTALRRYLGDGNIPIDNDQSERTIRPLTVGRKNWQFLGHPDAAPGRMQMVSVVSSAHRHHLVIEDYLEDVLRKLADAEQNHPADLAIDSPYLLNLLPNRWSLTHPASVRKGRIEEREDALDAKRLRRVRARIEARATQAAAP